ncbi:MAG: ATP-binding protein [bacterium]|nr:ATP-binding protein [bacterium]
MSSKKNFLEILHGVRIDTRTVGRVSPAVKKAERVALPTCDPVFERALKDARDSLTSYFKQYREWLANGKVESNPPRTSNSLLLGAPGSGKSHVAKKLAKAVGEDCVIKTINMATCTSPSDVIRSFDRIGRWRSALVKYKPLIVLIDEFDIRVGGTSAIQNMISPMYDGKDSEDKPLHGTALVFAGSYLRDRSILADLRSVRPALDVPSLCLDWHLYGEGNPGGPPLSREMLDLALAYSTRERVDFQDGPLEYLRGLEKIEDFLSRINGFTLELPSIGSPLECTLDPFVTLSVSRDQLSRRREDVHTPSFTVHRLEAFARARDDVGFAPLFRHEYDPILMYKDMVLRERLSLVLALVARFIGNEKITMRRADLAFLSAAPIRNGIRSLETLITANVPQILGDENLTFNSDAALANLTGSDTSLTRPWELWTRLRSQMLRRPHSTEGESRIVIDLKSFREKKKG